MRKIIIIGANNFQLPLIKKAASMGLETHVFAWEQDAVGKPYADFFYPISIVEKENILKRALKISPDGIISIGSDLATITVNYIAKELGLICNSAECTEITTNKYLMRQKLRKSNLPVPNFFMVNNKSQSKDCDLKFPVIVKPTDRSGSRGINKVDTSSGLDSAISLALLESFNQEVIVEEYFNGREFSIEMISWEGCHHFLQVTEKETSWPPHFVEKAHHQPADISPELIKKIIPIIKNALSVLGIQYGASHSEIIINPNGSFIITEIGARMGGDYIGSHLVELSTGFDFLKAVIDISLGYFKGVSLQKNRFSGIYYVFPKPGRVIEIKDDTEQIPEIIQSEVSCKLGDIIPQIKESSQRPACFIYASEKERYIPSGEIISIKTSDSLV